MSRVPASAVKGRQGTRRPGRPRFEPTPAQRRRVSILAGGGVKHDEIAMALGISDVTLRKNFEYELSIGAHQRRAEVMEALHRAAKKGNVSAARAYAALSPVVAAPAVTEPHAPAAPAEPGKKEQAQIDAVTAQVGTEWADLLPRSSVPQ